MKTLQMVKLGACLLNLRSPPKSPQRMICAAFWRGEFGCYEYKKVGRKRSWLLPANWTEPIFPQWNARFGMCHCPILNAWRKLWKWSHGCCCARLQRKKYLALERCLFATNRQAKYKTAPSCCASPLRLRVLVGACAAEQLAAQDGDALVMGELNNEADGDWQW